MYFLETVMIRQEMGVKMQQQKYGSGNRHKKSTVEKSKTNIGVWPALNI